MTTAGQSSAFVLSAGGGRRPLAEADVLAAANRGDVILVRGALDRLGMHRELVDLILGVIDDVCGSAAGNECRRLGLDRMHEILDCAQLERAVYEAGARFEARYPAVMKAIVHGALGFRRPFYIHLSSLARFIAPLRVTERDPERFMKRKHVGRLSGHGPHRDHWFGFPVNAINMWMAIGRVERENGLAIFVEDWGKEVARNGDYASEERLGAPVYISCEPGDVVLFHGRQAHATVPNVTDFTRVVISGRLCLEPPVAPFIEGLDAPCCYSPLVGTRFERFARPVAKLSWVYVVERLKQKAAGAVGRVERKIGGAPLRLAGRVARRVLRYRRADPYLQV